MKPDSEKLRLADAAIRHVLNRIHESPEIGWYMGYGTESFFRLREAYAAFHGGTADDAEKIFGPEAPRNPRRDLEKRIDELEEQLEDRAVSRGCGIEDIPTFGPQNLSASDFVDQVRQLLLTHAQPADFVAAVAAMFDVTEVPMHAIR